MKFYFLVISLLFLISGNSQAKHLVKVYHPTYYFFDDIKCHLSKDIGFSYTLCKPDKGTSLKLSFDTYHFTDNRWSLIEQNIPSYLDSRNFNFISLGLDKALIKSDKVDFSWFGEVNGRFGKDFFWTGPKNIFNTDEGMFIERKSLDFGLSAGIELSYELPYNFVTSLSAKQSYYYLSTYEKNTELLSTYQFFYDSGSPKFNINFNLNIGYSF